MSDFNLIFFILSQSLKPGEIYHFDIFAVEREPCSSELLIEVKNVQLNLELERNSASLLGTATTESPSTADTTTSFDTTS